MNRKNPGGATWSHTRRPFRRRRGRDAFPLAYTSRALSLLPIGPVRTGRPIGGHFRSITKPGHVHQSRAEKPRHRWAELSVSLPYFPLLSGAEKEKSKRLCVVQSRKRENGRQLSPPFARQFRFLVQSLLLFGDGHFSFFFFCLSRPGYGSGGSPFMRDTDRSSVRVRGTLASPFPFVPCASSSSTAAKRHLFPSFFILFLKNREQLPNS